MDELRRLHVIQIGRSVQEAVTLVYDQPVSSYDYFPGGSSEKSAASDGGKPLDGSALQWLILVRALHHPRHRAAAGEAEVGPLGTDLADQPHSQTGLPPTPSGLNDHYTNEG